MTREYRKDLTSSDIYKIFKNMNDNQLLKVDGRDVSIGDLRFMAITGIKIHASDYIQLNDIVKKYVILKELEDKSNE